MCGVVLVAGSNWVESHQRSRNYRCRCCTAAAGKAYYAANPDYFRNYTRKISGRYLIMCRRAEQRGIECTLTLDAYAKLVVKPCAYCGFPVLDNKHGYGVDRRDNDCGYTPMNAVPCCEECNIAKSDHFTYDEMVKWVGPAIRQAKLERLNVLHDSEPANARAGLQSGRPVGAGTEGVA